jgi:hypothetical protein
MPTAPPAAMACSEPDPLPVAARRGRGAHAKTQVGLVRPYVERLTIGQARERQRLDRSVGCHAAADLDDHRLGEGHHVLLVDEAHLEIQLRELRLPVATAVLVSKAARDLVVAVEATDHEQLLRALGRA